MSRLATGRSAAKSRGELARVLAAFVLLFSCSAFAGPIFNVTSTADAVDDSPGNDIFHTSAGACTPRAAIIEANRSDTGTTISLPAGT